MDWNHIVYIRWGRRAWRLQLVDEDNGYTVHIATDGLADVSTVAVTDAAPTVQKAFRRALRRLVDEQFKP